MPRDPVIFWVPRHDGVMADGKWEAGKRQRFVDEAVYVEQAEAIQQAQLAMAKFARVIHSTCGRIPTERFSFSDWHELVKAHDRLEEMVEQSNQLETPHG